MRQHRWLNQGQPQTLIGACFLLYLNAILTLLFALGSSFAGLAGLDLVILLIGVAAAYQIANERRWGYYLGITVAILPFLLRAVFNYNHNPFGGADPITLIFEFLLLGLLLHNQSREYEKVWFK